MKAKSSAHYQREYRKRLRDQGLVKKEVWVLPENARQLARLEKHLRSLSDSTAKTGVNDMNSDIQRWTTSRLFDALKQADLIVNRIGSIELIDGVEPSLHVIMYEFGDLPVFLTVAGEQIIVESVLWSVVDVNNRAQFNEAVLRSHKYFPLSTISLDRLSDGDYYHMFGALSATSTLENVVLEIETLADNVIQATGLYEEFLSVDHDPEGVKQ